MHERQRLSRDRWIEAAMTMVARDGLDRLGVEPLAKELQTTKGSFYWHFANRAELVSALLERWEQEATQRVITLVSEVPLGDRLAALLEHADTDQARMEWVLLAASDHPEVGEVVRRVNAKRMKFVAEVLGPQFTPAQARIRARLIYAMYLGDMYMRVTQAEPISRAMRRRTTCDVLRMAQAPPT